MKPRLALDRRRLRAFLDAGGVIAYATESCFGLGCDPRHRGAIERILKLKRRPWQKGLVVVASRMEQLAGLIEPLSREARAAAEKYWPGPYTLLLPRGPRASWRLAGRHDELAVRIPAHPPTRALAEAAGRALVSTSANLAGMRPVRTTREVLRQFGHAVWVIPGRVGKRRRPSTIIDPASGRVLRP